VEYPPDPPHRQRVLAGGSEELIERRTQVRPIAMPDATVEENRARDVLARHRLEDRAVAVELMKEQRRVAEQVLQRYGHGPP
jgi:hypothetical protein